MKTTKCITLGAVVINIGPWDYQYEDTVVEGPFTVLADGTLGREMTTEQVARNPLPAGAIEEDIALAWTAADGIVRADDEGAVRPHEL